MSFRNIFCLGADLFAGTACTFASPYFANENNEPQLDCLFIDEAGQIATANVVANPRQLEIPCGTVEQMKLVNIFCWLDEYSESEYTASFF